MNLHLLLWWKKFLFSRAFMNLHLYKIQEPQRISFLAQNFFTRLSGVWGEGLIFVEIIWKLGDNWVFHKMFKQEALFFCNALWKINFCIYLLIHKKKTFSSKKNYLFGFGLGTSFLFLNQYTESKHSLSLLIKRDYLQHEWPMISTKDVKAPEKDLAESYQYKMKWKCL